MLKLNSGAHVASLVGAVSFFRIANFCIINSAANS